MAIPTPPNRTDDDGRRCHRRVADIVKALVTSIDDRDDDDKKENIHIAEVKKMVTMECRRRRLRRRSAMVLQIQ